MVGTNGAAGRRQLHIVTNESWRRRAQVSSMRAYTCTCSHSGPRAPTLAAATIVASMWAAAVPVVASVVAIAVAARIGAEVAAASLLDRAAHRPSPAVATAPAIRAGGAPIRIRDGAN
jgi:hypothetical protein